MWIHFPVEMEVEAIFEDQLYREAIEQIDYLQVEELTVAFEKAICLGKTYPRVVANFVDIDLNSSHKCNSN